MDLKCTETFEKTYDKYYQICTEEEYALKLKRHKEQDLPGVPSKFRYRQIVSTGGSRSSKSWSILQLLLIELMTRKNIKITVWRHTKVTCRATIMETFKKIIMSDINIYKQFKENKQRAIFTYKPTGSVIIFEGADSIGVVLGSEQTISFFNEVTEFNKAVYLQITQRTSDRIIDDYNPSKNFWLEKYREDEDTIFIHSDFRNNVYCPTNIMIQLLSYEPWETGSYEVKDADVYYQGKPITPLNQPPPNIKNVKKGTANEYMWLVYGLGLGAEKPNRIYHNWHKISDEQYDELNETEYFGLDFGTANPTACVGVKYDGKGGFYLKSKLYKPLGNLEDSLATSLKVLVPSINKSNSLIICDSAKQAYIDLLLNSGYFAVPAKKGSGSVAAGISVVQSFQIYYVPDRDLDNELQNYSWKIDRYGEPTDEPIKKDDHLMDAIKYCINYLIDYLGIEM